MGMRREIFWYMFANLNSMIKSATNFVGEPVSRAVLRIRSILRTLVICPKNIQNIIYAQARSRGFIELGERALKADLQVLAESSVSYITFAI